MRCCSCGEDHSRESFPAPDSVIPICRHCLAGLSNRAQAKCSICLKSAKVYVGGVCASCATDGRKVKGLSHATDKQAVQVEPER